MPASSKVPDIAEDVGHHRPAVADSSSAEVEMAGLVDPELVSEPFEVVEVGVLDESKRGADRLDPSPPAQGKLRPQRGGRKFP